MTSGLVIDTRDLGRRSGAAKTVRLTTSAPEGIGTEMIGVPPESPIDLDVHVESVGEGILVSGDATVQIRGECARCLGEVTDEVTVDLQELFLHPGVEPDDEEAHRVQNELVDVEPVLRDVVVLDLPFTPLCRPDCAGLCPTCGVDRNADPGHQHGDAIDARWAQLTEWSAESD
ncbi:YceD family protein [Enemella sp. A6]|uniref:YceD family protein n=1 Tax=Enemella sp. A6 TaxID=3440152 RepID=UPI003EB6EA53